MAGIYDQYKTAFRGVSAYVVVKDGPRVATVAFKHPRDGAGRLYAYVHWLGVEMVRGYAAGGFGYDKRSAACAVAVRKLYAAIPLDAKQGDGLFDFYVAISQGDARCWADRLRGAGFDVWSAI